MQAGLAEALLDALPQTQCTRCGFADCRAYAEAIAAGGAAVNRCPPGGAEGVRRLAAISGRSAEPLDTGCGSEGPRLLARIREAECIGCALCLKACPVDAIVGAAKLMHTVVDAACTGCELCVPVCPIDCIDLLVVTGTRTGWSAWSAGEAGQARRRYRRHLERSQAGAQSTDATSIAQDATAVRPADADAALAHPGTLAKAEAIAAAFARSRTGRRPKP